MQNQTKFIKIVDHLDLLIAKSLTEKDIEAWIVRKPQKKTVQAQRNEGWGFLAAGDFALVCLQSI